MRILTHSITTNADGAVSVYAIDLDDDGDMDVLSASIADLEIMRLNLMQQVYQVGGFIDTKKMMLLK